MIYLRRRDTGRAGAWWTEVERYAHGAPGIVRELLRDSSVACDPVEAEQALARARAHPAWGRGAGALSPNDWPQSRSG
jgi:hypothetical protein